MSSEHEPPIERRAAEIHSEAAGWVIEQRTGEAWSSEEQTALDGWLSQSLAHRVAYVRFSDAWNRSEKIAALQRQPSRAQALLDTARRLRPPMLRVAAALAYVAVLGAGAALFLRPTSNAQTFSTPVGGHETVILEDGTRIELNTDTTVRVSETQGRREVQLDKGEAFFQVKHDPARLFVVTAGTRRITDIGTKFLVRRDADRFEVALLEGRAAFDNDEKQKAVLSPGDVLVASADTVSLARKSEKQLDTALAWRQGVLVFNRTTLADAAAEYNRYNRQKILIGNPSVGQLTINGTLPVNNPEEFARVAQTFFRLRIERQAGAIVLSR